MPLKTVKRLIQKPQNIPIKNLQIKSNPINKQREIAVKD